MKKGLMFIMVAIAFVAFSFTTIIVENYNANVVKSEITWKAYKVTGSHTGTVNLKEGSLDFTDNILSGGAFSIDMTSLVDLDLEGEWKEKLEKHLKSPDFFGVEKYPTASFKITRVAAKGTPGDYKVIGHLTIKETTKEIKFYAHVENVENTRVVTADIKIDRSDYNVRYGSGSFFSGLGDKTIYDEFDLNIKLVTDK